MRAVNSFSQWSQMAIKKGLALSRNLKILTAQTALMPTLTLNITSDKAQLP